MNYLKRLPEGWKATDKGYILELDSGASCEIIKSGKEWVVVNIGSNGAKWGHCFPSFKQLLIAIQN